MSRGKYFVYLILEDSGAKRTYSPVARSRYFPERGAPHNSDNPLASSPSPPSISPSRHPHMPGRFDPALDFVQYKATPIKHRSSLDSPTMEMKLFDSRAALSPTWSQPRSFERWSLRDFLNGQCAFGDGKAGLEAEAEGCEPGEDSETDEERPDGLEGVMTRASSVTEEESQEMAEWFSKVHPELRFVGKAPRYESGDPLSGSNKSGSDPAGNSRSQAERVGIVAIEAGMASPVKAPSSLTESDSQSGSLKKTQKRDESQNSGLGESALIFSQPSLDPLHAFLDIFERASSSPRDSQV